MHTVLLVLLKKRVFKPSQHHTMGKLAFEKESNGALRRDLPFEEKIKRKLIVTLPMLILESIQLFVRVTIDH